MILRDVALESWRGRACSIANRNFTCEGEAEEGKVQKSFFGTVADRLLDAAKRQGNVS